MPASSANWEVLPGQPDADTVMAAINRFLTPETKAKPATAQAQAVVEHVTEPAAPDSDLSMLERDELLSHLIEIAKRDQDSLRLFEPRPQQKLFLDSMATEMLVRGGNRGGKTLIGAIMCAKTVRGLNPRSPKTNGRFFCVGKDLTHCGKVLWRKLSRPGAFQVIKDPGTGRWRAFRPDEPWDKANAKKAKPAPPLIPSSCIKAIAWENKKDDIPKTVYLKNGWELEFFSSIGAPRAGIDVDAVWFDEEIEHNDWYTESSARILDRNGFFYWTATPQAGTEHLYKLHTRAEEQASEPEPSVAEFYLSLLDNPFISQKSKDEFSAKLSDDEYRIRVLGDFALLGTRVYGEFSPRGAHGCDSFPVPHDWTRFIAIDPGRTVCAVLFAAVPPKGSPYAGRVVIYDELYIEKCNAAIFATRLKGKLGEQDLYQMLIDHRAGRQHEMGSGVTVEEQYSAALKAAKVSCAKTGHRFTWGSDDPRAGIEAVKLWMHLDADGRSKILVFRDKCPKLLWEMSLYSNRRLPSGVVTDEPVKVNDHAVDALRYLAMANLRWVKPRPKKSAKGYTTDILKRKAEKRRKREGSDKVQLW